MAEERGGIRTGCSGCFVILILLGAACLGLFFLKPEVFDPGIDWVLYKPPPTLPAPDPAGPELTAKFFRELMPLGARRDRFAGRAELTERQVNGYLQEMLARSTDLEGIERLQADFSQDQIDFFATVNPGLMERTDKLREFAGIFPAFARNRRWSLQITLLQPRIEKQRLTFDKVTLLAGRLPIPLSGRHLKPWLALLPGAALAVNGLSRGLPLPPRTTVRIVSDTMQITPAR